jgi:hypothetical protein
MPTRSHVGVLTPLLSTEMKHTLYKIALQNVGHRLPTFEPYPDGEIRQS